MLASVKFTHIGCKWSQSDSMHPLMLPYTRLLLSNDILNVYHQQMCQCTKISHKIGRSTQKALVITCADNLTAFI